MRRGQCVRFITLASFLLSACPLLIRSGEERRGRRSYFRAFGFPAPPLFKKKIKQSRLSLRLVNLQCCGQRQLAKKDEVFVISLQHCHLAVAWSFAAQIWQHSRSPTLTPPWFSQERNQFWGRVGGGREATAALESFAFSVISALIEEK